MPLAGWYRTDGSSLAFWDGNKFTHTFSDGTILQMSKMKGALPAPPPPPPRPELAAIFEKPAETQQPLQKAAAPKEEPKAAPKPAVDAQPSGALSPPKEEPDTVSKVQTPIVPTSEPKSPGGLGDAHKIAEDFKTSQNIGKSTPQNLLGGETASTQNPKSEANKFTAEGHLNINTVPSQHEKAAARWYTAPDGTHWFWDEKRYSHFAKDGEVFENFDSSPNQTNYQTQNFQTQKTYTGTYSTGKQLNISTKLIGNLVWLILLIGFAAFCSIADRSTSTPSYTPTPKTSFVQPTLPTPEISPNLNLAP